MQCWEKDTTVYINRLSIIKRSLSIINDKLKKKTGKNPTLNLNQNKKRESDNKLANIKAQYRYISRYSIDIKDHVVWQSDILEHFYYYSSFKGMKLFTNVIVGYEEFSRFFWGNENTSQRI